MQIMKKIKEQNQWIYFLSLNKDFTDSYSIHDNVKKKIPVYYIENIIIDIHLKKLK